VTIADLLVAGPTPPATGIPDSLREFAEDRKLIEADIEMLSNIRFRGEPPRSARRWAMIYDAIRMSRSIDNEDEA
jgi:hypothetical protein